MKITVNQYYINDLEFNLDSLFKRTIEKALLKYNRETSSFIASKLGICERTLNKFKKKYNL